MEITPDLIQSFFYLGKGIRYPFTQLGTTKEVSVQYTISGEGDFLFLDTKVNSSLMLLFDTNIGERFMVPQYGSRLRELVFQEFNEAFEALATEYITTAIYTWEKRIKNILDITFVYDTVNIHRVDIRVTYELITGQVVDNFVYPFLTS